MTNVTYPSRHFKPTYTLAHVSLSITEEVWGGVGDMEGVIIVGKNKSLSKNRYTATNDLCCDDDPVSRLKHLTLLAN